MTPWGEWKSWFRERNRGRIGDLCYVIPAATESRVHFPEPDFGPTSEKARRPPGPTSELIRAEPHCAQYRTRTQVKYRLVEPTTHRIKRHGLLGAIRSLHIKMQSSVPRDLALSPRALSCDRDTIAVRQIPKDLELAQRNAYSVRKSCNGSSERPKS